MGGLATRGTQRVARRFTFFVHMDNPAPRAGHQGDGNAWGQMEWGLTMSEAMIKGHELFRSLSFEEVEHVHSFSGPKPFKAGEFVFRKGDQGSHFFVVLEGRVNLILPSEDNESQLVVGRLGKGDILGLSPLLGTERHTTLAKCGEDSTVLAVEIAPFRRLLEDNPRVGLHMMTVMARAYFSRYIDTLGSIQGIVNDLS